MIPELQAARRGYTVRYKNKTLLSTVDPVSQAERIAVSAPRLERTLYFCPSPLLGYGLVPLLERAGAGSAVLCVETDAELLTLSQTRIGAELLSAPAFALTGIKDAAELYLFVREKWGSRSFRRVETVKLSGGWQLDGGVYDFLAETLQEAIAAEWGNALTLIKLGRRFMYNFVRNVPLLGRFPPAASCSFGSKPVLVLGAGPSLDRLLDKLAESGLLDADKDGTPDRPFVLLCVDTCLPILKERNIVPDLVVILESQFWNLADFAGSKNMGVPAAVDLSSFPVTVELLGGPVYFFCTRWASLRIFERLKAALPAAFPPLGSVSLAAVELARRLGSGQVLTGGIDFSYTLDATHARGSPAHLSALRGQNRFTSRFSAAVFRPGVAAALSKSGERVKTDPAMKNYRALFEREFSGGRVADIEGSGLPLGLKTLTLADALAVLGGGGVYARDAPSSLAPPETAPAKAIVDGSVVLPAAPCASRAALLAFVEEEKALLQTLLAVLTNAALPETAWRNCSLDELLDGADYLWAHFPDCAGAEGKRPPASDVVFLKRVRAELEPFIKLWDLGKRRITELSAPERA